MEERNLTNQEELVKAEETPLAEDVIEETTEETTVESTAESTVEVANDRLHRAPSQPPLLEPQLGDVVHYTLTGADADTINNRREVCVTSQYFGNPVSVGQRHPAIVVAVFPNEYPDSPVCKFGLNLQIILDGNDQHWVTSVAYDESAGKLPSTGRWY